MPPDGSEGITFGYAPHIEIDCCTERPDEIVLEHIDFATLQQLATIAQQTIGMATTLKGEFLETDVCRAVDIVLFIFVATQGNNLPTTGPSLSRGVLSDIVCRAQQPGADATVIAASIWVPTLMMQPSTENILGDCTQDPQLLADASLSLTTSLPDGSQFTQSAPIDGYRTLADSAFGATPSLPFHNLMTPTYDTPPAPPPCTGRYCPPPDNPFDALDPCKQNPNLKSYQTRSGVVKCPEHPEDLVPIRASFTTSNWNRCPPLYESVAFFEYPYQRAPEDLRPTMTVGLVGQDPETITFGPTSLDDVTPYGFRGDEIPSGPFAAAFDSSPPRLDNTPVHYTMLTGISQGQLVETTITHPVRKVIRYAHGSCSKRIGWIDRYVRPATQDEIDAQTVLDLTEAERAAIDRRFKDSLAHQARAGLPPTCNGQLCPPPIPDVENPICTIYKVLGLADCPGILSQISMRTAEKIKSTVPGMVKDMLDGWISKHGAIRDIILGPLDPYKELIAPQFISDGANFDWGVSYSSIYSIDVQKILGWAGDQIKRTTVSAGVLDSGLYVSALFSLRAEDRSITPHVLNFPFVYNDWSAVLDLVGNFGVTTLTPMRHSVHAA